MTRRVRDSAYWGGLPRGTPITPGMKPRPRGNTPMLITDEQRRAGVQHQTQLLRDAFDRAERDPSSASYLAATLGLASPFVSEPPRPPVPRTRGRRDPVYQPPGYAAIHERIREVAATGIPQRTPYPNERFPQIPSGGRHLSPAESAVGQAVNPGDLMMGAAGHVWDDAFPLTRRLMADDDYRKRRGMPSRVDEERLSEERTRKLIQAARGKHKHILDKIGDLMETKASYQQLPAGFAEEVHELPTEYLLHAFHVLHEDPKHLPHVAVITGELERRRIMPKADDGPDEAKWGIHRHRQGHVRTPKGVHWFGKPTGAAIGGGTGKPSFRDSLNQGMNAVASAMSAPIRNQVAEDIAHANEPRGYNNDNDFEHALDVSMAMLRANGVPNDLRSQRRALTRHRAAARGMARYNDGPMGGFPHGASRSPDDPSVPDWVAEMRKAKRQAEQAIAADERRRAETPKDPRRGAIPPAPGKPRKFTSAPLGGFPHGASGPAHEQFPMGTHVETTVSDITLAGTTTPRVVPGTVSGYQHGHVIIDTDRGKLTVEPSKLTPVHSAGGGGGGGGPKPGVNAEADIMANQRRMRDLPELSQGQLRENRKPPSSGPSLDVIHVAERYGVDPHQLQMQLYLNGGSGNNAEGIASSMAQVPGMAAPKKPKAKPKPDSMDELREMARHTNTGVRRSSYERRLRQRTADFGANDTEIKGDTVAEILDSPEFKRGVIDFPNYVRPSHPHHVATAAGYRRYHRMPGQLIRVPDQGAGFTMGPPGGDSHHHGGGGGGKKKPKIASEIEDQYAHRLPGPKKPKGKRRKGKITEKDKADAKKSVDAILDGIEFKR